MEPEYIRTMEDTRKLQRGQLVAITFDVEADGSKFSLINLGIFERLDNNQVTLAVPGISNDPEAIARSNYIWSEQGNSFSRGAQSSYVDKSSSEFARYIALFKQLGGVTA